jgi:hypothetical protein
MNPYKKGLKILIIYLEGGLLSFWSNHTSNIKRLLWIEARLATLLERIKLLTSK